VLACIAVYRRNRYVGRLASLMVAASFRRADMHIGVFITFLGRRKLRASPMHTAERRLCIACPIATRDGSDRV
jgi:hypothetical protein